MRASICAPSATPATTATGSCATAVSRMAGTRDRSTPGHAGADVLVNRPGASLPHARDCVFALTGDEEDSPAPRRWAPQPAHDYTFDPFAPARKKSRADGPMETVTPRAFTGLPAGSRHRTAANMLHMLMQTARLNTLDGAGRFSSPPEWLPEILRAAEQFFIADDVPASEFLFTDPASWADGEVARRLEEAEPGWRKGRKPYAMLCWFAHDLSDSEINPATRRKAVSRSGKA